jgi:hypothetical protein
MKRFFLTAPMSGRGLFGQIEARVVPPDRIGAVQEYLEAHSLLPDGPTLPPGAVSRLCNLLDRGEGTREQRLRALVILAHVGREPALGALRRYARCAPPDLAGVAALALDECELWSRDPRPPYAVPAVEDTYSAPG